MAMQGARIVAVKPIQNRPEDEDSGGDYTFSVDIGYGRDKVRTLGEVLAPTLLDWKEMQRHVAVETGRLLEVKESEWQNVLLDAWLEPEPYRAVPDDAFAGDDDRPLSPKELVETPQPLRDIIEMND